jgi:hypothetical protein
MRQDQLTRPIIGIENRTALEVFDIMCDRILNALDLTTLPPTWHEIAEQAEHVALGIDCRGPDVTRATSVLIELIRAAAPQGTRS